MSARRSRPPWPVSTDRAARDCAWPGERVPADVEAAYRRGYQQGAYAVVDAVCRGVAIQALQRWVNWSLHKWRYRGQPWRGGARVKVIVPPNPPETPKGKTLR